LTAAAVKAGAILLAQTTPYGYDKMARLQNEQQCTPANCATTHYAMQYAFDWTGKVTWSSVPSSANGTAGQPLALLYGYDGSGRLSILTSNWNNGATYPATLFNASSNGSSSPSYGPMGLLNASLGISTPNPSGVLAIHRGYDSRGRVVSEVDTQVSNSSTASPSSGTITISGTEQTKTRPAAPGSAVLTVSGVDGTTQVCSFQTVCNAYSCWQVPILPCPLVPNSGAFTTTIWKDEFTPFTATAGYGGGTTDAQLASGLAASISASGAPVSALSAGSTVIITATSNGPATDYPFTISNTGGGYNISENVPYTSIGGDLTGGVNANPSDKGTVSVTISGNVTSVPFQSGSTPSTIATALAAAINAQDGSYVTASYSGGVVTLHSLVGGTAADWQLTETVTWDTADFASASFAATDSNMNGGINQSSAIYSYVMPLAGGYDANGNLLTALDSIMGQWNYTYDSLNRLTGAQAPVSQPTNISNYFIGIASGWTYDAFGNRKAEAQGAISGASPTAAMPASSSATYNTSNQLIAASQNAGGSLTYDASGNVVYDGINSYLYDAESRLCAVRNTAGGLTGYIYDAAGIRVAKGGLTAFTCNFATNGFAINTSWTLGPGGEQIGEFAVSGTTSTWTHSNVFAAGKLLATYNALGTYFDFTDWLGTKRVEINAALSCETGFRSLPYGNGLTSYAPTAMPQCVDATEQHYTGKERDTESGNDYFEARYYASSFGRFMSPDWSAKEEPVPYAKLDDPQSLNLYAYVEDNPSGRTDPSGHACKDGNFQCQLSAAWNKTHEIVNMVIAKISPAPKVPAPAQKPGQAPVSPVAGVLPPAADGAATAAKYATRRMPKLSPRAIPREVPGSDPVPRQVPPGEVPEISPGASTLEKLGIAALNLVKMLGNTTTDLIPPIYIPKDITRPSGCGATGHECTI
jgi:RHS repeat-associated protein